LTSTHRICLDSIVKGGIQLVDLNFPRLERWAIQQCTSS
jgi:hypothetical protein